MLAIPKVHFSRKPEGISAAYLPWKPVGRIDFESYERGLERTWGCGLTPAINMDTGFANLLTLSARRALLPLVARLTAGRSFVTWAFAHDLAGDLLSM